MAINTAVLAINAGSSTVRFAVYRDSEELELLLRGKFDRIGQPQGPPDFGKAADLLMARLADAFPHISFAAIGHRIVHGMTHSEPALLTPGLVEELHGIIQYDPEHMPQELELIEALRRGYPAVPQLACFDTAFHSQMPRVATVLPIPRRYESLGVRRYGFHGLSYEYLLAELERVAGPQSARGRVILAHLGNGASLAAVRDGIGVDTTMGFTPAGGVMMGTRTGDLDPGVASWLLSRGGLSAEEFGHLVNHESGLLGVSETSSDIRDLLAAAASDPRAAEAVELFCYQVRKAIGSFAAALNGVDTLVFSGGIGENAPAIRKSICGGLGFLGLQIDDARNTAGTGLISASSTRVAVRVIPTDEERMIARHVRRLVTSQIAGSRRN